MYSLRDTGYSLGSQVDATFRATPQVGIGFEASYQRWLDTPSKPFPFRVDVQFGHREMFGLSALVEVVPLSKGYSPRRGPYGQATVGMYANREHNRTGPSVLILNYSNRGPQITAVVGYRFPFAHDVSASTAFFASLEPLLGVTAGIRVGAGFR
jgi:hypothetical protein